MDTGINKSDSEPITPDVAQDYEQGNRWRAVVRSIALITGLLAAGLSYCSDGEREGRQKEAETAATTRTTIKKYPKLSIDIDAIDVPSSTTTTSFGILPPSSSSSTSLEVSPATASTVATTTPRRPRQTTTTRVVVPTTASTAVGVTTTTTYISLPPPAPETTTTTATTMPVTAETLPPTPLGVAMNQAKNSVTNVENRRRFEAYFNNCFVYTLIGRSGEKIELADPQRFNINAYGRTVLYLTGYGPDGNPYFVAPDIPADSPDNSEYRVESVQQINTQPVPHCGINKRRTVEPVPDTVTPPGNAFSMWASYEENDITIDARFVAQIRVL